MVLLPDPERPVNQMVTPWRNWGGFVSVKIAATAGRLNHSGRESLGKVVVSNLRAGDVRRLDAGGDFIDGTIPVFIGQVDHLLEIDHRHADLVLMVGHAS